MTQNQFGPHIETNGQVSETIVEFVRGLNDDGLAAIELLGELPAVQTNEGLSIRIPKGFPVPEQDLKSFYDKVAQIGLLRVVGKNVHGIGECVWELNDAVYEQVLSAMTTLGRETAHRVEQTTTDDMFAEPDGETTAEPPVSQTTEPQASISQLREELSSAKTRRATSLAESQELKTQYRATVDALTETARSIGELRERLKELHEHRLALKRRVKQTNIDYMKACIDSKQSGKRLAAAQRATRENLASTALDLLLDEAQNAGIPIEQLIGSMRKKAAQRK